MQAQLLTIAREAFHAVLLQGPTVNRQTREVDCNVMHQFARPYNMLLSTQQALV